MSREVDERVVEMRFDNGQFERNVSQTMSTLDKFKQKLNFTGATKGLEDVGSAAQKVNMSGLGAGVESVSAKFSALQVIGVTALANITNSAVNAGKNLVKSLSVDQITTGWQKFSDKTTSVATLVAQGNAIEDVNAQLDRLNWFTDETSYNFTDMVSNIAKFTATGKGLEESVTAMEGIATWAALSGQNAQKASSAMYQLSQALSAGYMRKEDWKSIQNVSMDTEEFRQKTLEAAVALKTLKDNGDGTYTSLMADAKSATNFTQTQFVESLTEGAWFTSDVMMEVFSTYSSAVDEIYERAEETHTLASELIDEIYELAETESISVDEAISKLGYSFDSFGLKAFEAGQKARTFRDAMDSVKDAVSTGWMNTFELIFGDANEATELWTDLANTLYDLFAEGGNTRNRILESALGKSFTGLAEKFNDFMAPAKKAADTVTKVTDSLKDLGGIVDEVILGKFGNGEERFNSLTEAGYNWCEVQNEVNKKLGSSVRYTDEQIAAQNELLGIQGKTTEGAEGEAEATVELTEEKKNLLKELAKLTPAQAKAKGYTDEQIAAFQELGETAKKLGLPLDEFIDKLDEIDGRWLLITSFKNVGNGLISVFKAIGEAWKQVFPSTEEEKAEKLFDAFTALHRVTRKFKDMISDNIDEITRTFKGLFAALDIIGTVVGGPIKIAFKLLTQLLSAFDLNILDVTAAIGDAIVKFRDWIDKTLDFTGVFEKLAPYVVDFAESIKGLIESFKNSKFVDTLKTKLAGLWNTIKKFAKFNFSQLDFGQIVEAIWNTLRSLPDKMAEIGRNIIEGLQNGIGDKFTGIVEKAKEIANKIITTICDVLGIHSPSTVMFEIGKNIIIGLVEGIAAAIQFVINGVYNIGQWIINAFKKLDFSSVGDTLSNAFDKIKQAFEKIDWKKLLAIIPIGVALLFVKEIYDVVKALTEGMGGINSLIDGLHQIEVNFAKVLKAESFKIMAEGFKELAEAVAILVGAVIVLGLVLNEDTADKMYQAVAIIFILSLTLYALTTAMRKMQSAAAYIGKDGVKLAGFKTGLLTIGLAILALGAVVKMLGNMEWEDAKHGLIAAGLVAVGLIAFVSILGVLFKFLPSVMEIAAISASLIQISIAMGLMVGVCKLAGTLTEDDVWPAIGFVIAFGAFVAALAALTKTKEGKYIPLLGGMMVKIAFAMGLMVGVCKLVGLLTPDDMINGALFAASFALFVGMLVKAIKLVKGEEIAKIGGLLLGISVSMAIMIGVCKLASKLNGDDVLPAILFAAAFLGFVAVLVLITKLAPKEKIASIAATLVALSIAITLLAGVALLLSLMPDQKALWSGIGAVFVLCVGMAAMVAALNGATKSVGNIIALAIAIGVLAGAVALLAEFVDLDKLVRAAEVLAVLMLVFAVVLDVAGNMGQVTLTLLAMTAALAVLGAALYFVAQLPLEQSLPAAVALGIVMIALAVALRIIGKMQEPSTKALIAIGAMTLVVAALGAVLYFLQGLNFVQAIGVVAAITTFLAVLFIAVKSTELLGAPSFAAIGALALVMLVAAALGAVLYFLQGLNPDQAMGVVWAITVFLLAMEVVCMGAAVVGQFASVAIPGLLILVAFIGVLGLVVIGLASLAMDVIARMPKLGSDLSAFMANVQPFMDGIKNIPDDISDKIGKLCKAIIKLGGTEIVDAIASFFSGGSSLADLGAELKTFGDGMASFTASIGNIDSAIASMSKIKDIQGSIEDVDLSGLSELGDDLASYSAKASSINVGAIDASITSVRKLVNLVRSLVDVDYSGVSSFNVAPIGKALNSYSSSISGVNQAMIMVSIATATRLKNFINSLTDLDSSGIGNFKTAISQLGSISIDSVVKAFAGGAGKLNSAGANLINAAVSGMKSASQNMTSTVNSVMSSIQAMFSKSAGRFKTTGVILGRSLATGLRASNPTIKTAAESMAAVAVNGAKAKRSGFYSAGKSMVDGFAAGITAETFVAEARAAAMAQAALDAAKAVLESNSPSKAAMEIGKYFGEGFEIGIKSKFDDTWDAAAGLAMTSLKSLRETLKMHSPPPEAVEDGEQFGEGYEQGIESTTDKVSDAAANLGIASLDGLSNTITEYCTSLGVSLPIEQLFNGVNDVDLSTLEDALKGIGNAASASGLSVQDFISGLCESYPQVATVLDKLGISIGDTSTAIEGMGEINPGFSGYKGIVEFNNGLATYTKDSTEAVESTISSLKDLDEIADKVIRGDYGSGQTRFDKLTEAGYNWYEVQNKVNEKLGSSFRYTEEQIDAQNKLVKAQTDSLDDQSEAVKNADLTLDQIREGYGKKLESKIERIDRLKKELADKNADLTLDQVLEGSSKKLESKFERAAKLRNELAEEYSELANMNLSPTIRPVVDLTDVQSGVSAINNMLNLGSTISTNTGLNNLSWRMRQNSQNGSNDDVVSAINSMHKDLGDVGNTTNYNINGFTYNDDKEISRAIDTIIRKTRVDRRA